MRKTLLEARVRLPNDTTLTAYVLHLNAFATYAAAWGRNKKEAEQKAAMNALAQINGDPVPFEAD